MTALPTTQRFYRGHRVRIGAMPEHMSHFPSDCDAIVEYSYAEKYGGREPRNSRQYGLLLLDAKGWPYNSVSWYDEDQLTLLDPDRDAGEAIIQSYIVGNYR